MNKKFTNFFFSLIVLVNIYFINKPDTISLVSFSDRVLELLIFQFDYLLLSLYVFSIKAKTPELWLTAIIYFFLFLMGMSSIFIKSEQTFDHMYSYIHPIFRLSLIYAFLNKNIKNHFSTKNPIAIYALWILLSIVFLYFLQLSPRQNMFSYNFYWLVIVLFVFAGLKTQIKHISKPTGFEFALFLILIADLYYILPPQQRKFEFTYIIIRIINSIGEFLLVSYILTLSKTTNSKNKSTTI
ncbi:hypothetical protein [Lacihabitans lacunae]|uniref:YhhN-like protein n=1 Tax=Lacihabitans lacunae TaxID=1028214 RepID=A0ABV7YYL7_9BACT